MPPVGRVDVTAADAVGTPPFTTIELPADGGKPLAADWRNVAAMALANDAYRATAISNKVSKTGDTMSDALTVNASTTNSAAFIGTGNGTGAGVTVTGGATGNGAILTAGASGNGYGAACTGKGTGSGVLATGGANAAGLTALAGGGNNHGTNSTGNGTGAGIIATGGATGNGAILTAGGGNAHGAACTGAGTGVGIIANPGAPQTNLAPTCSAQFAGYVQLTGTDPNQGVDPGANNALHAIAMCKAWYSVSVASGGGPFTPADSYNIDSVTEFASGVYDVAFKRAMLNASYAVVFTANAVGLIACTTARSTTGFRFTVYDSASQAASGNAVAIHAIVLSRQ